MEKDKCFSCEHFRVMVNVNNEPNGDYGCFAIKDFFPEIIIPEEENDCRRFKPNKTSDRKKCRGFS